jgi:hypothetical protein
MTQYASLRVALAVFATAPAAAQDVAPGTPAELRDFKLNPEQAPPVRQPLPTTEPLAKPPANAGSPAIVPSAIEVPPRAAPLPRLPAARNQPAARKQITKPNMPKRGIAPAVTDKPAAVNATVPVQAVPVVRDDHDKAELARAPTPRLENIAAAPPPPPAPSLPWPYILAALLAAAALAMRLIFARRFRRDEVRAPDWPKPDSVTPVAPTRIPATLPATVSTPRPKLEIKFTPDNARISLTNLTIKGHLLIVNTGAADAAALRLNAAVISASKDQAEAAAAYFVKPMPHGKILGTAKIGEQIALDMDLMIPIADLQTFSMGKQQLLVPIILVRLAYYWDDASHNDEVQLSCLIGREANPAKPKMGAIRLDLGPRSFGSLGQRPLFA